MYVVYKKCLPIFQLVVFIYTCKNRNIFIIIYEITCIAMTQFTMEPLFFLLKSSV